MSPLTRHDYTIAWICALPLELAAARVMLDSIHSFPPNPTSDPNAYELGELNGHYIVIASLPAGVYGTVSAAAVISRMRLTFPRLQYGLMVGIGGGVPTKVNDIRLGDVVVSEPSDMHSGVIQYDYGKAIQGGQLKPTGTLNKPPQMLLMHISQLKAKQMTEGNDAVSKIVQDILKQNPHMAGRFSPPEPATDRLFNHAYHHANKEDCDNCDKEQLVTRKLRDTRGPHIHYGLIASGDQVMKDSDTRDRLAQEYGILCFEMEAAGLMDELSTLVIRGICDYCDSHKQKEWQGYAALTAAAFAKLLMSVVPVYSTDPGLLNRKVRHWNVPLARNPRFVGRQEVGKVEKLITVQDGPRNIAVTGLGGVGKTQVALELAYRMRERDNECSIFWVPCTTHAMVEQAYLNIAQTLEIQDIQPAEVKQRVKSYLSSEHAGKWLLVFDNADDMDMWLPTNKAASDAALGLEEFLPQSQQGRVLLTTRNRKLAVELTSSNIIHVPDTDKELASRILGRSLLRQNLVTDRTTTDAFLEQLAFLPLAIAQASAYINKNDLSLSTYLALLQEQEQEVVDLLSEDFRDAGRYKDIQNPVITTWLISFEQIQHQNLLAADCLCFMACINPQNIPRSFLPLPTSKKHGIDALGLLNAYSFINGQDMELNLHKLVHLATRNWLRKNGLYSHQLQKVADQIQKVFPDDDHENRGLWRQYLPHALSLIDTNEFKIQHEQYVDLIEKMADCLASDGRHNEAEILFNDVIEIKQREIGPRSPSTLISMASLVSTYWHQGRWDTAERLGIQVLDARKIVLGAEHPDTLSSMSTVAGLYKDKGRYNEAETLDIQAMMIRKKTLGVEHPDTLDSMASLASIYRHQGRWDEAETLHIQLMDVRKIALGYEHPGTLSAMNSLALTYRNQGRWDEAEALYIQVMETSKAVLGANHPDTLTSMNNLATTIYKTQERWEEAETIQIQVMNTWKRVLGTKHPGTLIAMNNLATTYWAQGRLDEAETLHMQVIETRRTVLGSQHPATLSSMRNLAYIWNSQGKHQQALAEMIKCSELSNQVLGPDHPKAESTSRAVERWTQELSPDQPTPTVLPELENSHSLQELSSSSTVATVVSEADPLIMQAPIQRLSLENHPLIRAVRISSPTLQGQDLPAID